MKMPCRLYWLRFLPDGGPTVEMTDLPAGPQRFRWSGIYGLQIGPWFVGTIKGRRVAEENEQRAAEIRKDAEKRRQRLRDNLRGPTTKFKL